MLPINENRHMRGRGKAGLFPLIGAALALGLGAIVMLLWNWILPDLLSVRRINYWQSVGLLVLCRILFGNFGRGGMGRGRDGMHDRGRIMREKWMNMSPDERSKFRQEWKDRCRPRRDRND